MRTHTRFEDLVPALVVTELGCMAEYRTQRSNSSFEGYEPLLHA
jgi:hypothetical protein